MSAGKYNILLEQGIDFSLIITEKIKETGAPISNVGASATFKIKKTKQSTVDLVSLTVGSGITLGGTNGVITVEISDTITSGLDFDCGVYELIITYSGGDNKRVIEGTVKFSKEV